MRWCVVDLRGTVRPLRDRTGRWIQSLFRVAAVGRTDVVGAHGGGPRGPVPFVERRGAAAAFAVTLRSAHVEVGRLDVTAPALVTGEILLGGVLPAQMVELKGVGVGDGVARKGPVGAPLVPRTPPDQEDDPDHEEGYEPDGDQRAHGCVGHRGTLVIGAAQTAIDHDCADEEVGEKREQNWCKF